MRRALLVVALLAVTAVAGLGYHAIVRERQFRALIAAAETAIAAGDSASAVEHLSGAIALRSDSTLAWFRRGQTYHERGDLSSALRDLRKAVALDPTATRALEELGDVLVALGRHARAADQYDAYLAIDDRAPRVFYKLAFVRFHEGLLERAEAAVRRGLALNADSSEAQQLLGLVLLARDRTRDAVEPLRRAITLSPAAIAPREDLAAAYGRLGRRADEVRELEALAARDPDRAERYDALALAYARLGRTDQAVVTLARAADRFPDAPHLMTTLGLVWLEAAESRRDPVAARKALHALDRAVQREPSSEAWTLLGRAWIAAGEPGRAMMPLERATLTYPIDRRAFPLLADTADRLGRRAQARDALARAFALDGDQENPREAAERAITLGEWSAGLGDARAAAIWFERAARLRPGDAHLAGRLADAQLAAGDADGAETTIGRYLDQHPDSPAAAALRARLR